MANFPGLTTASELVLEQLVQKAPLVATIKVEKSLEEGRRGASVDVWVEYLEDVVVRTYTKADHDARTPYVYDPFSLTAITVNLNSSIYAGLHYTGWNALMTGFTATSEVKTLIQILSTKIKASIEGSIGAKINGLTGDNVVTIEFTGTNADRKSKGREVITALQEQALNMNTNGVSSENRFAYVGREAYLNLLATDELLHADKSGETTPLALRAATIGTVAGFTVVSSEYIDDNAVVVAQKEAFVLVSRPSGWSPSAPYSELIDIEGAPISLRVNINNLGDTNSSGILAETFFEVAETVVPGATSNPRAKKLVFTDAA
jgi:hypothetical protein